MLPLQKNWKGPRGCPQITWMQTVLDDLKCCKVMLTEAVNMAPEAAGYEWRYAFVVLQAGNDGDGDDDDDEDDAEPFPVDHLHMQYTVVCKQQISYRLWTQKIQENLSMCHV